MTPVNQKNSSYGSWRVQLAADLVNTDCARKGELLPNTAALEGFLGDHGLGVDTPIDDVHLHEIRAMRAPLRAVFEAPTLSEAVQRTNELLRRSGIQPQLVAHAGAAHLELVPASALPDRLIGLAAAGLAAVLEEDGFDRMRQCADQTCTDVFVDASRNRSRRYCRPQTCGNRAKVAAYRQRQQATQQRPPQRSRR
jgi:hypothetical protein